MPTLLALDDSENVLVLPRRKVLLVSINIPKNETQHNSLDNFAFDDYPVRFLTAETAGEAVAALAEHPDIAVMVVDVSGGKKSAGLNLVKRVRGELGNRTIRVMLLGDPSGNRQEQKLLREYDIGDYRDVSALNLPKLFTSLTIALQAFERLVSEEDSKQSLQTILDITKELYGVRSVEEFCLTILTQLQVICKNVEDCFFCIPNENSGELMVIAGKGAYATAKKRKVAEVVEAGLFDRIKTAARAGDNRYADDISILCISRDGHLKGAVILENEMPLTLLEKRQMELICANITLGLENADMFEEIKRLAFNDSLTGLDSRAKFRTDVQSFIQTNAKAGEVRFAVVQFVLDHLPELNIALGHDAGDELLQFVSEQLTGLFPDAISLARTSGNGFGICIPYGLTRDLRQIPKIIHSLFEHGPSQRENLPHITPRIGLAIYPEDADNATALWRNTNIALATLKSRGGNYFCFYNNTIADDINARVEMNNALRLGIGREDLSLNYQPQVDLESGTIVGVEALIRWKREDGTFVAPDEFIPIAEASGLIVPISEWVLKEACMQRKRWLDEGGEDFKIAVNLSLSTFQDVDFTDLVRKTLADTGCPPELLELEVTESVIMEDPEQTLKNFQELGKLGVSFSIDDFGTGYSSLSYLRRLPVSVLKIDKAFIDGMTENVDDASIAHTVISLGRNLGLKVLAEGVETMEQVEFLRAANCQQAQGYFFSRPVDAGDIMSLIRDPGFGAHGQQSLF